MKEQTKLQIKTPRWSAPLLKEHARYRGAYGGRGSGKSHFFAELLIERCVLGETHAVCLREIQKSLTLSVKKLLEIKIESLGVSQLFEVQREKIVGKNGSLILFQGLQNHTSDSIKSLEGFDIAWLEEAQNISQRSLDILRPTIRKMNSEIWASWNPANDTDPIEFLKNDPPKNSVVVCANYTENPWFPAILLQEVEYDRARNIDKFNHIWLGQYEKNGEARIFKNWTVDEFEAERGTIFRLGADWGYSIDPTVLIRSFIVGRTLYIDYEAHQHKCEIFNIPELFGTVPDSHLFPIIADSSRPETIAYCRKNGYPRIYPSVKGENSVEEGIEWLQSFDIIVHPRCKHTIDELNSYKYKIDKLTGMITGVPEDKKNHVIDALRYSCESARKKMATDLKIVTVKPQRNHW